MTLSTPVKIVALAALALVLGLGGLLMLTSKRNAPASVSVPPVVHHARPPAAHAKPHRAPVHLNPGLPAGLRAMLMHRPVAVVVVYSGNSATDRAILRAARSGARSVHAGFVALNVAENGMAAAVSTWTSTVQDPSVIVVRRPGTISFVVNGLTDSQTIAQAASNA